MADLAITVADEWHGRGVATGLLRLLCRRAAEVGIAHFTADMLADNRAVLALVHAAGGIATTSAGTVLTSRIDIRDEVDVVVCEAAAVLRAAAEFTACARYRSVEDSAHASPDCAQGAADAQHDEQGNRQTAPTASYRHL